MRCVANRKMLALLRNYEWSIFYQVGTAGFSKNCYNLVGEVSL